MSQKFCPYCDNLLLPGKEQVCTGCKSVFPVDPANNILKTYSKPHTSEQYRTLISGVHYDPTAAKIYQKCRVCKTQITCALLGAYDQPAFICACEDGPTFNINGPLIVPPSVGLYASAASSAKKDSAA